MKAFISTRILARLAIIGLWTSGLLVTVSPLTVWAQTPPSLENETETDEELLLDEEGYPIDEVIALGTREGFTPVSNITPDVSFNAGDILALGVTDVGELIDAINAETGSDSSEPPIILLNGRPVASRRDIRRFPSEAIRKVDVLPPEAALKFSSDPNRRVLNFSLRRRFNAITGNLKAQTTTDGGRNAYTAGGNYLRIQNKTRIALNATFETANHLSEAERDIPDRNADRLFARDGNITAADEGAEIDSNFSDLVGETVTVIGLPSTIGPSLSLEDFRAGANNPNITDQRFFRDLEPETENIAFSGSLFRPVGEHLSINGAINADFSTSDSLRGLIGTDITIPASNPFSPFGDEVTLFRYDGPLARKSTKSDVETNLTLFGDYATWRWSLEGQYSQVTDKRDTDRSIGFDSIRTRIAQNDPAQNPFGPLDISALSQSDRTEEAIRFKGRINGRVATLPAGPATGSINVEYSDTALQAVAAFNGERSETALSRGVQQVSAEMDIPLTRAIGGGGRRAAGRSSLRLSGGLNTIEDIGTLSSYGAGLSWNATYKLSLQGSLDYSERAPSLSQIGNPVLIDPNVRVTDFTANDRVFVDRITGGNPDLLTESRRDIQLTARYRHSRDLNLSTRYRSRNTEDAIVSFPFLTPQIASAFPDRLVRDNDGQLIELDARPVNAALVERDTLRTGMNWSKRFANTQTGTGQGGDRGSRGPRRGNRRSDRIALSLYHTWRLKDAFQFRQNGPVFDLLDGAALRRRGGTSQHQIEARVSLKRKNTGGSLSLEHETGSTIDSGFLNQNQGLDGALTFDPLTTANLRLYYDLGRKPNGRQVRRDDWRRGLRLTLDINNLANDKQSVSNALGTVPFGYEKDAFDPLGRTVMVSLRKIYTSPSGRRRP